MQLSHFSSKIGRQGFLTCKERGKRQVHRSISAPGLLVYLRRSEPHPGRPDHEEEDVYHDGRNSGVLLNQNGKQKTMVYPRFSPRSAHSQNGSTLLLRYPIPQTLPIRVNSQKQNE